MKTRDTTIRGLAALIILVGMANSARVVRDLPANDKESVGVPSGASLGPEARGDQDGADLDAPEGKSAPSFGVYADEPGKPIVLGSTSKVAIVYSEGKSAITEKSAEPTSSRAEDRSWRVVKAAPRDSYLDALNHSHSSKDPREGVVGVDPKPKITKAIRREYSEGPVYRPVGGHHVALTESSFSYGPPTPEPFLPTPSDAYSLPVQTFGNFDSNRPSYAPPKHSYGSPSAPDTSYGVPGYPYSRPAPPSQNSFGPSSSSGYSAAGSPQQAYGRPPPVYGAPYAIQDYSQHLPSLPSIDFSWPFALKLNAFTLAKILLKLVIFKMIVKFIALICLLLFIPKLEIIKKDDKNDNDDDARQIGASDSTSERLNVLTALVTSSIEKYEAETGASVNSGGNCTGLGCRMRKLISGEDTWNDTASLLKRYVTEETDKDEDHLRETNRLET